MGVSSGAAGGYFCPQAFVREVDISMKYYGNMLGVARILDTATGNPLPYPTANDTTVVGELVGEGQQVASADVAIGHVIFGAFKFSTKLVKCSIELLQDSAFNLDNFFAEQFGIRLGLILNTKFTLAFLRALGAASKWKTAASRQTAVTSCTAGRTVGARIVVADQEATSSCACCAG